VKNPIDSEKIEGDPEEIGEEITNFSFPFSILKIIQNCLKCQVESKPYAMVGVTSAQSSNTEVSACNARQPTIRKAYSSTGK
jgi:hypothetical protein